MLTYTLKVIEVHIESEDAVTIRFKQPTFKKISYYAGQYLTISVNINKRKYMRPYSLSSAPGIDNTLNITVKRLPHGIVSNHLIDIVKEGDMLEVIEPMGDFIYKNDIHQNKGIFLWGAGSGITALMPILTTALNEGVQNITLSYCNKSLKQTIFLNRLEQLAKQYPDRFILNLFCTQERSAYVKFGRIEIDNIRDILKNAFDKENSVHYICGPAGLKQTVKEGLENSGIGKHQIFSEDFERIVNENDLEGVQTRFVQIVSGNKRQKFEVVRGKSILEAGLDCEIDIPYSCQTGSCTLCRAKLISGEVKKVGSEMLKAELKDDEQLLCCCYPLTENVVFEIN